MGNVCKGANQHVLTQTHREISSDIPRSVRVGENTRVAVATPLLVSSREIATQFLASNQRDAIGQYPHGNEGDVHLRGNHSHLYESSTISSASDPYMLSTNIRSRQPERQRASSVPGIIHVSTNRVQNPINLPRTRQESDHISRSPLEFDSFNRESLISPRQNNARHHTAESIERSGRHSATLQREPTIPQQDSLEESNPIGYVEDELSRALREGLFRDDLSHASGQSTLSTDPRHAIVRPRESSYPSEIPSMINVPTQRTPSSKAVTQTRLTSSRTPQYPVGLHHSLQQTQTRIRTQPRHNHNEPMMDEFARNSEQLRTAPQHRSETSHDYSPAGSHQGESMEDELSIALREGLFR